MRDITDTTEASSTRMAYFTIGMAVAPMILPTLGGYIDGLYCWQANFYLMVALAFSVLSLCYFDQAETLQRKEKAL